MIRVRVTDDQNASVESDFTVNITDDGLNDGAAESFVVNGGQGTSPYYNFTDSNGSVPDFTTYALIRGSTYMFTGSNVSGNHPFMIGESYGDMNSNHVLADLLIRPITVQKLQLLYRITLTVLYGFFVQITRA